MASHETRRPGIMLFVNGAPPEICSKTNRGLSSPAQSAVTRPAGFGQGTRLLVVNDLAAGAGDHGADRLLRHLFRNEPN